MNKKTISIKELKKKKYDTGELIKIIYTSSGGMTGGHNNKTIDLENKTITKEVQEWHNTKPIETIYKMSDENIKYIKNTLNTVNFPAWRELEVDNTIFALDAPINNSYFIYEKDSFNLEDYVIYDEEERKLLIEFNKYLNEIEKEENIISKKELKEENTSSLNSFIGIKMNNSNKYCPECGEEIKENQNKCSCGYKLN